MRSSSDWGLRSGEPGAQDHGDDRRQNGEDLQGNVLIGFWDDDPEPSRYGSNAGNDVDPIDLG